MSTDPVTLARQVIDRNEHWELHEDEDPDMPIRPGRAVVLTWEDSDYGFTWAYPHRHEEEA